jgi:hypothetical protein
MIESRRTPRRPVVQGAWIFLGGGAPSIPCMMMDLSDAGARLKVEATTVLPAQFILVMSRDGRLNRRCCTVWRDDEMVGVKFLSQESVKPSRQPQKAKRFEIEMPEAAWPDEVAVEAADAPSLVPEHPKAG